MRNLHKKIQISKEDQRRTPSQRQQLQQNNRKRSHQRNYIAGKENNHIEKRARSQETVGVARKEETERKESTPKAQPEPRPTVLQEQNKNTKPQIISQSQPMQEIKVMRKGQMKTTAFLYMQKGSPMRKFRRHSTRLSLRPTIKSGHHLSTCQKSSHHTLNPSANMHNLINIYINQCIFRLFANAQRIKHHSSGLRTNTKDCDKIKY